MVTSKYDAEGLMGLLDVRLQPMSCAEMSATVLTMQRCPSSLPVVQICPPLFSQCRDVRLQSLQCRDVRHGSRYDGGGQGFCGEDQEGKRELTASASSQPYSNHIRDWY